MTITFIGHGYVGLVTAAVFAELGNKVYVIGRSEEKIQKLKKGDPIIYEPGLSEILKKNIAEQRIFFTLDYNKAIPQSEIIFIAVGTPSARDGKADLTSVKKVAEQIGRHLGNKYTVVACKSTVPIGTNRIVADIIMKFKSAQADFDIASCPEFLREGQAILDTQKPDRIIIGTESKKALELLKKVHQPLASPIINVTLESAELIKYASNSLLATKISFANLISLFCEKTGADAVDVLRAVGLDRRIGPNFLDPGIGYGGSCFPKDVKALTSQGDDYNIDISLLQAVESVNRSVQNNFLEKIRINSKGKNLTLWGLAFKPNTDDIRDAPALYILETLLKENFKIKVYDPEAMANVKKIFGDKLQYGDDPYNALNGSDLLAICTEWDEFKTIDLQKIIRLLKFPIVVDGRNIFDPIEMKRLGFKYIATGRNRS